MKPTVQEFFATLTEKATADLQTALDRIPEDKRAWSPAEKSRTAMDQFAECAILNGSTAKLLKDRTWDGQAAMDAFFKQKEELANDYAGAKALLAENMPKLVAAIRALTDDDLAVSVDMPWGPMTLGQIMTYPYWNMSYHEGQINYIASMLGCLE